MEKDPNSLTPDEAALYLNVCRATIYNWGKQDPSFPQRRKKGPRLVIFDRTEIDAWLASLPKA